VVSHKFAEEWMKDFTKFEEAVRADNSYMSDFTSSMSLVLDEFYSTLPTVGVSAISGVGVNDFFKSLQRCAYEYET
jgi:molecular chaperone GrpE (heat shock protein)